MPEKTAPRIFLIDGYALIYRSYFAFINRPLTNARGENTSAAWGVANFLLKIREELQPEYLAVVFDAGRSEREIEYPEYKATREKMPDDLSASIAGIRELVEAFGCPVLEVDGFEADDVIGTLVRVGRERGMEAVIISGDKDFYQLVGPGIRLLNPGRGGPNGVAAEWVDEDNAHEKFGIRPDQVTDYLALVGDSSDNVPGAPGVGPKTAKALLDTWETLDAMFDHADEVAPKRARTALLEHGDDVRLSKRLVTIRTDVPIEVDFDTLKEAEPNHAHLRDLLIDYEFRTLIDRIPDAAGEATSNELREVACTIVSSADYESCMEELGRAEGCALLLWASATKPAQARVVALAALPWEGERAYYFPLDHTPEGGLSLGLDDVETPANLPSLTELDALSGMLADPDVTKVGHGLKDSRTVLAIAGHELLGADFDVQVASYVTDPGRRSHDLEVLALDVLGVSLPDLKTLVGSGKSEIPLSQVTPEALAEFSAQRLVIIEALADHFEEELEAEALRELFVDLEMPLVAVLSDMERRGIGVDDDFFREMSGRLARDLKALQEELHKIAGTEFNLNSTPQLREVLFERLELPVIKRTKTGPSTDSDVLEELAADGHAFPIHLLEYRQLEKLRNTYVDALPKLVNPRTGRIHTRFNQAVAATGRLSSSEPNLQNIPIRTDLGREIRKGFVADSGYQLLAVDYSQVELRVLAHFSGDAAFVEAFRNRVDVHRQTAAVIFGVDLDDVTADMRARAKTINFATLYGQGDFSLARQLGISRAEAKDFIEAYFERFAGVRQYLDEQIEHAKTRGYVETLWGRRRYVPELRSRNWNVRSFGERVAQNTPIQGTAADLMKQAMLDVDRELRDADLGARLLLQVHDELLLEVPEEALDETRELVVAAMEAAMELEVPLVAEAGAGRSWFDCKG